MAKLPERICLVCGFSYLPKKVTQETCGIDCRNTLTARRSAAKRGDMLRGRKRTGRGRYPKFRGRYAHRAAAEILLGRPLKEGEVVHHLNGDKDDWSPHNVIVMPSQSAHARVEKLGADKARARGQRT